MDLHFLAAVAKLFSRSNKPKTGGFVNTAGVDVQSDAAAVAAGAFPGMDSMHACVTDIEAARGRLRTASQCKWAPKGWLCTRAAGHHGPCAAIAAPALTPAAAAAISQAETDVLTEVRRQIDLERFSDEHDDIYDNGELSSAGTAYALAATDVLCPFSQGDGHYKETPPEMWPWDEAWWKSTTPRRDLVKAAALIIAEIKKIDRATARGAHGDVS